MIGYDHRNVLL